MVKLTERRKKYKKLSNVKLKNFCIERQMYEDS